MADFILTTLGELFLTNDLMNIHRDLPVLYIVDFTIKTEIAFSGFGKLKIASAVNLSYCFSVIIARRPGPSDTACRAHRATVKKSTKDRKLHNVKSMSYLKTGTTGKQYKVYTIKSQATFGEYGSPDYVSRTVQMKVGDYGME